MNAEVKQTKAGLYCGLGSRGKYSVYWAKILADSPDTELVYLDGGDLEVAFTAKWAKELGLDKAKWNISFHDGPIVVPGEAIADIQAATMAVGLNAIDEHGKMPAERRDSMIGTPAFVYAACGQGEIIACNCHPEGRKETRELISAVFGRLVGRRIAIPDFENFPKDYTYAADGTKETLKAAVAMLEA